MATDLKHTLRKYEFPNCAHEALIRIEQLLVGRGAPSSKQYDMAMEIIAEFVFCETDRRGARRSVTLTSLQDLQLIDVICDYLGSCASEITKNTVFLFMFGGSDSLQRLKVLITLTNMALLAPNTSVLSAVGVWLQQMGCLSTQSFNLVESIIQDNFFLKTSNQATLRSLATTVPQFIANFTTSVTELYMQDVEGVIKMPPKNLLEAITSWVSTSPSLCMSAQLNPAALPSGAIPMAAVTPLAGLMRWCALAALYVEEEEEEEELEEEGKEKEEEEVEKKDEEIPRKRLKLEFETERTVKQFTQKQLSTAELYTKLHLGVLHSLRAGRRVSGPPTAIGPQLVAALVARVQAYAHQVILSGGTLQTHHKLQECLDRIGQAIQVALANGCIYGNINTLLDTLQTLPENRLLQIVIKTHQPM